MNKHFDYIAEANVTASNQFHGDKVSLQLFKLVVSNAIQALKQLDGVKKTLFYGRELPPALKRYQDTNVAFPFTNTFSVPTFVGNDLDDEKGEMLTHSIIGLATESGELLELLSKAIEGGGFDEVNFIEEIGDGFWYAAIGLNQVKATFNDVQTRNIAKLRHRFPDKFTEFDANNRDLLGERKILEAAPEAKPEAVAGKPTVKIEQWMRCGNVLLGDVYGHPVLGNMQGCKTSLIINFDEAAGICETRNTIYKLGKKFEMAVDKA